MLEPIVSLVALGIACLAYYRATRRQVPTVYFFASSEDPLDPDWRVRIHNPTQSPVYLLQITIHEPCPDWVWGIEHHATSLRGTIARNYTEHGGAPSGSSHRRVREIHLRIDPGAIEDLRVDIRAGDETEGDPPPYSLKLDLEWTHELPFPDGWLFGRLYRRIAKSAEELEALRLAARTKP